MPITREWTFPAPSISTKYDCNWASLTTAGGAGLRAEFDPHQRFHCRAGSANGGGGYVLFVNQQVSLPNDFTQPVVPDLIMTLTAGNVLQGSFRIGSMTVSTTSSNAVSSIKGITPFFSTSGGGNQFGLTVRGITNASYSVWASTNLLNWEWEGAAAEIDLGEYQFFDPASTNAPRRFYRISAP